MLFSEGLPTTKNKIQKTRDLYAPLRVNLNIQDIFAQQIVIAYINMINSLGRRIRLDLFRAQYF